MGLRLSGKGSILSAIGGAVNTGANAVVAGVKDVGDLASAGMNELTGNQAGVNQSMNAIKSNNSNLSGENFWQNLGGLGSDIVKGGVNPIARPVVGLGVGLGEDASNALTGNNMTNADFSNEGGLMGALDNYATDNHKNTNLGGARQLLGNTIQTGVNIATAGKGKLLEGALEGGTKKVLGDNLAGRVASRVAGSAGTATLVGGGYGAGTAVATAKNPKEALSDIVTPAVQLGALGGAGGLVTKAPDIVNTTKANTVPLDEVGGINNRPIKPPRNQPETVSATPVEPSPKDLAEATNNVQADLRQPIDWTNVSEAPKQIPQAIQARANTLKSIDSGAQGGQLLSDGEGGYKRTSEHSSFYRQVYAATGHAPRQDDWKAEAERQLRTGTDEESLHYQNLLKQAKAKENIDAYQKADKASGYDKAKYQIPKGQPAKKFIQALWDKTHSPEHAAAMDVGAHLGNVREMLKGVKIARDQAQQAYDSLTKRGATSDEPTRRAASAELFSQKQRYQDLKNQEQHYAMTYGNIRKTLDEKYPDINLTAKKGVRLTTNTNSFETAKPIKVTSKTTEAKAEEPYNLEEVLGHKLGGTPYTGPNLNEGAFSKEDIANLEAKNKIEEAKNAPSRSIVGDKAIIDGIKNGDSDAALVRTYMDATGVDEEAAKKALGVVKIEAYDASLGAPENNPKYGKGANYGIKEEAPQTRLGIKLSEKRQDDYYINKILLRATAPGRLSELRSDLSKYDFANLKPEDQALADKLRDNSPEEIAKEAKDPETFLRYAKAVKDIEDEIHATRNVADPFDITPYRQKYGAGFHVSDENGVPTSIDQYEGREQNFAKSRHFSTYKDLEAASGLKRNTANFHEDIERDVGAADHYITSHSIVNGLKERYGDDAAFYGNKDVPYGMKELKEFKNVWTTSEIAKKIDARQQYHYSEGPRGELLKRYDSFNAFVKSIKLSGSGFHNVNVGLSKTALEATGVPSVIHAWASDPFYRESLQNWIDNGTMEKALHGGVMLNAGNEFDSSLVDKVPGIKQLHDALFQRQIPFSKMTDFEKYTNGMDLNKDYSQIRGVARGVNNIYGGINRLVDGFSPETFKQLSRGILAVDYNEGQIRTLIAAFSRGGKEGEMARRMLGGKLSLLASPGVLQGIVNHQIGNTPDKWAKFIAKQIADPNVTTGWKTAGGTPKRISLLATPVNKIYRAIAPAFNSNNPNKLSGLEHEAIGNEAAGVSFINSEVKNQDYYGNKMQTGNVAHDIGQAINSMAPIPVGPAARALEGGRFGKNPVVQTLAGGQSAISPAEAAVDISGIGRGQANPDSPQMQIMNNRQLVIEGVKGNVQAEAGIYAVHPSWDSSLNKNQQAAVYNSPYYEGSKWAALQNPTVFNALKKQNDFAKAHGEPSNPLFDLSPQDLKTVMTYKHLSEVDPGHDANDTAALIYARNKDMISKFEQNTSAYEDKMQQLFQQSGGLKGDQNSPKITPGGVAYPSILQDKGNQATLTSYLNLLGSNASSATKQQFIADHPEVTQMFNASFNFENARRAKLNEPLLKDYPQVSTQLQSWINNYFNASKTDRRALRNSDMNSFKAMQDYMAQVDEYELAQTAGQAKFQGAQLSQKNLKEIYNLGKYDINPSVAADGTTTYEVNPQAAYSSGTGSKSSKQNSTIQKLLNDIERAHAVSTVKFMGHPAKIRKQFSKKNIYLPQPKRIKLVSNKAPKLPSEAKLKPKSVSVV